MDIFERCHISLLSRSKPFLVERTKVWYVKTFNYF